MEKICSADRDSMNRREVPLCLRLQAPLSKDLQDKDSREHAPGWEWGSPEPDHQLSASLSWESEEGLGKSWAAPHHWPSQFPTPIPCWLNPLHLCRALCSAREGSDPFFLSLNLPQEHSGTKVAGSSGFGNVHPGRVTTKTFGVPGYSGSKSTTQGSNVFDITLFAFRHFHT